MLARPDGRGQRDCGPSCLPERLSPPPRSLEPDRRAWERGHGLAISATGPAQDSEVTPAEPPDRLPRGLARYSSALGLCRMIRAVIRAPSRPEITITTIRGAWRWKTQKSICTLPDVGQREPDQQDADHRHADEPDLVPASGRLADLLATVVRIDRTGLRVHRASRHGPFCPVGAAAGVAATARRPPAAPPAAMRVVPEGGVMTTSEILTGARTMWELVDRRAQVSPDHPLLIAADGETVTFGQFRDRVERVAAGLHDMGVTTGSVVSWQLPTRSTRWSSPSHWPASAPSRTRSSTSTASAEVGFALRQTGAELFVIPATWRGTDFAAIAERCAGRRRPRRPDHPQHRRRPPRGRPRRAAPAARGDERRGRPDPLDLLHLRARRPTPRACSTPTRR